MKIDKSNRVPLYYQLMDIIISMIEQNNLKEGAQLPSERELCEKYNVSRSTVRQAIQELEREAYVYRIHGKGTFVAPQKFKQDLSNFYSFTEEMKSMNKVPSSKVLNFKVIKAEGKLAVKMNIENEEEVYLFIRLRLADNDPMMLEVSYVPRKRFPNLTKSQLENQAMYDIFTDEYNTRFTYAEEIFQPVTIRKDESEILNYSEGLPGMLIERLTYEDDNVIEYTKSIARGDRFKYKVTLES